jgi:hypothetical protein
MIGIRRLIVAEFSRLSVGRHAEGVDLLTEL